LTDEQKEEGEGEIESVITGEESEAPPHPVGFAYSFNSDRTALQPCGCGGAPALSQTGINISEDGFNSYTADLSAAITDSSGQAGWPAEIDINASNTTLHLYFEIRSQFGTSPYDARGSQSSVVQEAWGGWAYVYTGTYQRRGGPSEDLDTPQHGSFTAAMVFSYTEQRLVSSAITLDEA
jgi:hypothetical protein